MQAFSDAAAVSRRMGTPARVGAFIGALGLLAVLAAPTLAAKGAGSVPYIRLAATDGAVAATAQPRLGSSVRFATGYPTGTKNPWVSLSCYQNGLLVYGEGGTPGSTFVLGGASSDWVATGGAASCQAELGDLYWRGGHQYYTYLATTNFDTAP